MFKDYDNKGHTLLMHAASAGSALVFRLVHQAMASVFSDSGDLGSEVSYMQYVCHRGLPRKRLLWRLPRCLPCVGVTCLTSMGVLLCTYILCKVPSCLL